MQNKFLLFVEPKIVSFFKQKTKMQTLGFQWVVYCETTAVLCFALAINLNFLDWNNSSGQSAYERANYKEQKFGTAPLEDKFIFWWITQDAI